MVRTAWYLATVMATTLHAATNVQPHLKAWGSWHNSLQPAGRTGEQLTLALQGDSDYSIVIPTQPTPQERKAAEELQTWLQEMSGAKLPICPDENHPAGNVKSISVGDTTLLEQSGLPTSQENLGDEGYGIAVQGNQLFLWGGRTRGTINAVFAFLEEDLECRWYTSSCRRIPRRPTLVVAPIARTYVPALRLRDPFYYVSFDGTWSLRNRTNAPSAKVPEEWGGHIDYDGLFVHTFHRLMPPAEYFDQHPEYYMQDPDGNRNPHQLCTTHPDVIQIVTESVRQCLQEHPHTEVVSVSKTDGGRTCLCERCKELDEAEGTHMASLLHLVNAVAQAIELEHPRVIISTLAYLETVTPPKTMRPARNVAIRLCNDSVGSWTHPFTPAEQCRFGELLRQWAKVHDRIYIWDYVINFSHYLAPMPNMQVIAQNIRFFVDHHAEGVMTQANYQTPGSERDWLRSWVIAKLLWNPSWDVWELMLDFVWGYYGASAPAIAEYTRLLWETGEKHQESLSAPEGGIRYRMDHPFLGEEFLNEATGLFERAIELAQNGEVQHRVEEAYLPVMYVQLCRGPEMVGSERYGTLLHRFEAVAHRLGITHLREGTPDLKEKVLHWHQQLAAFTGEME